MNLTDKQISQFNKYYHDAGNVSKGIILLGDYGPKAIGFWERIRANRALRLYKKALSIYPEHFASLLFIGKIYQRFGAYKKSLQYLEAALIFEKGEPVLYQEASLVAMHLDQIDKAIRYSGEAVRQRPDDIALLGNHSMNLLLAGKEGEAKEMIDKALLIDPDDKMNKGIKLKIESIIAGRIERPTFNKLVG